MMGLRELRKAAESATKRIESYDGFADQSHDMNARSVMRQGQPETPRPHKTTQDTEVPETSSDRFTYQEKVARDNADRFAWQGTAHPINGPVWTARRAQLERLLAPFAKTAEDNATGKPVEATPSVPATPSQGILQQKKITLSALPIDAELSPNAGMSIRKPMSFRRPVRPRLSKVF